MRSHRCCHAFIPLLTPCVPRIARRHAALRIAAARPFRFRMMLSLTRPRHARIMLSPPPNQHWRRGEGRGECLLGGADRMMCVGLKKSGRVFFPRPLASVLSRIDALVVVAHEALLTNDVAIRSAWMDVRCLVARLKITSHAEAAFPAFDI